jgi:hypothetical protein
MPKFEDLNLDLEPEIETLTVNEQVISVKKYLPVEQKAAIISLCVKGSVFENIVNEVLMDAYFHVFIVENYTDIAFLENLGISDVLKIYDQLRISGVLDAIISVIPFEEYNSLVDAANSFKDQMNEYKRSGNSLLESIPLSNANQNSTKPRTRKSSN